MNQQSSSNDDVGNGVAHKAVLRALELEAFLAYLCRELRIEQGSLNPDVAILDDLGLDSIAVMELSVVVEELGYPEPEDVLDPDLTLRLLHQRYLHHRVNHITLT